MSVCNYHPLMTKHQAVLSAQPYEKFFTARSPPPFPLDQELADLVTVF